ncbi:unnamed protein product, partial [Prorocentrum cordatum]
GAEGGPRRGHHAELEADRGLPRGEGHGRGGGQARGGQQRRAAAEARGRHGLAEGRVRLGAAVVHIGARQDRPRCGCWGGPAGGWSPRRPAFWEDRVLRPAVRVEELAAAAADAIEDCRFPPACGCWARTSWWATRL